MRTIASALAMAACASAGGCGDSSPQAAQQRPSRAAQPTSSLRAKQTPSPPVPASRSPEPPVVEPVAVPDPVSDADRELYATLCGACHGTAGRGDGPLAAALDPAPTDFGTGFFKLGSTRGSPSDADLASVVEHGVPGSAMPGSADVPRPERERLAATVRRLAFEGYAADLLAADPELDASEAEAIAAGLLAPGDAIEVGPRPGEIESDAGERQFQFYCTECHGPDGRALDAVEGDLRDHAGRPVSARDLTRDPLKGGATAGDIALRIQRGMPGTPMPATTLSPADTWALAEHVVSLRDAAAAPAAPDAELVIGSVDALPAGPDDPAWSHGSSAALPLRHLRQAPGAAAHVRVALRTDGERLAVRVEWDGAHDGADVDVALRLERRDARSFPWAGPSTAGGETWCADAAAWTVLATASTAVGTVLAERSSAGTRHAVVITGPLGESRPEKISVALREASGDGSPASYALTGSHLTVRAP